MSYGGRLAGQADGELAGGQVRRGCTRLGRRLGIGGVRPGAARARARRAGDPVLHFAAPHSEEGAPGFAGLTSSARRELCLAAHHADVSLIGISSGYVSIMARTPVCSAKRGVSLESVGVPEAQPYQEAAAETSWWRAQPTPENVGPGAAGNLSAAPQASTLERACPPLPCSPGATGKGCGPNRPSGARGGGGVLR